MPKSIRYHHIQRIDDDARRTHCWRGQVQCRGHIVIRFFSDHPHGGKRKALQAAIAWRDAMLAQIQHERYQSWLRNCTRIRSNNTSGMAGVGRYIARDSAGGEETKRAYWQAFWQDAEGKRRSRKFTVGKYGEKRAKALAFAARREALAALVAVRKASKMEKK